MPRCVAATGSADDTGVDPAGGLVSSVQKSKQIIMCVHVMFRSDGDICFANSTCFDDDLMKAMSEKAELLQPGAYFITFTKPLTSTQFEILEKVVLT